ncbi:preprotein translocase subunit YajC [Sulfurimonas sp. MAG313]|nr:preprotein translocase subunit YajC [Sulfurimonas sp. MAG313]MDF1880876.1 preprotein translocase subunit YajC [Sulfurimonas sp. MAG313]
MESMIMMVGLFAIMYFIIIRPQQQEAKKHKEMLSALAKGDKIVTNGGLIVDIIKVDDAFYTIKLDKDTQVRLDKNAVARKYEDEA